MAKEEQTYRKRRHAEHSSEHDDFELHLQELIASKRRSGALAVSATCSFDGGPTKTGVVSADGCNIAMDLPWNKFCGPMTGLWNGPVSAMDYYVLGHNKSSNELTVWWYDALVFAFITLCSGTPRRPQLEDGNSVLAASQNPPEM